MPPTPNMLHVPDMNKRPHITHGVESLLGRLRRHGAHEAPHDLELPDGYLPVDVPGPPESGFRIVGIRREALEDRSAETSDSARESGGG